MTDTSTSDSPDGASRRIPTAAQALARLDMPLLEAMMTQRAVRRVLPDPVDDAVVLKCIELALRAPTGWNGQNWEFVVVRDRRVKEKLATRYRQAWSVYVGIGRRVDHSWSVYGGMGRRIAAGDESMEKMLRAVQWQVDHFSEIPVLVVPCLHAGAREGRVPFVPTPHVAASSLFGSIYPSVQNLLLAARAMGLGACVVTLPLWSVTSARKILGLPVSVTPCCIVPLGWPRGRYGPTTRKPIEQVTHLDAYGNRVWLDSR
jgi:nitroreductase